MFRTLVAWACLAVTVNSAGQAIQTPSGQIPAVYFGMHIHKAAKAGLYQPTQGSLGPAGGATPVTPWPDVPFGAWRLWDAGVSWFELEPAKGEWHFDLLDQYIALAEQHHVEVLLTLGQTPAWASARPTEKQVYRPGNAAEPKSMDVWRDYVRTVATRYKGKIRAYEIWNEPNLKLFYTGTPEQLVQLTREAYQTLQQVDPSIIVVSPSVTGDVRWLSNLLKLGVGNYCDVIGFHFYVRAAPEAMVPLVKSVKRAEADNRIASKPVWDTEAGWGSGFSPKPFTPESAAAYVARAYVLNWAAGVSRFYWYSWDNHWWVALQMTADDSRTLTPAAHAYATTYAWMVGAAMKSCTTDTTGTWICQLSRGSSSGWIVWNPDRNVNFTIPAKWQAKQVDSLDGSSREARSPLSVSESPVLIH